MNNKKKEGRWGLKERGGAYYLSSFEKEGLITEGGLVEDLRYVSDRNKAYVQRKETTERKVHMPKLWKLLVWAVVVRFGWKARSEWVKVSIQFVC